MTPKKAVAVAGAQLPMERGNCVLCANAAERACQRCGDFYCSRDCQLQDWQRHRYICFPLPALVYSKSFSVHPSTSTDELSTELTCISDKADNSVVNSGLSSPLTIIIPDLKSDEPLTKVGTISSSAGTSTAPKSVHVPAAPNPNENTVNPRNKNVSPPKAIVPPSNTTVFISGFRSPNRCYIRDASETADKAFSQMCLKVNTIGNELPRMVKPLTSKYCLVRYNGMFQRASVLSLMGHDSARLLLFDQGIAKSTRISDMREINEELLSLPCFSVQVQLKDVPNFAITKNVIEFLSQFEGEKFVAVYTKTPGAINVELLYPETKNSLNARICSFCANKNVFECSNSANKKKNEKEPPKQPNPQPGLGSDKPNPSQETTPGSNNKNNTPTEIGMRTETGNLSSILIQDEECAKIEKEEKLSETKDATKTDPHPKKEQSPLFQSKPKTNGIVAALLLPPFEMRRFRIPNRDGIDVYIVDVSKISRGVFGAIDSSSVNEFSTLHSRLSEMTVSEPYTPTLKEFVLARYEDSWYRGRVEQVKDTPTKTKYRVMFLDYTKAADISEQDIRRYPVEINTPCTTNICVIEGFPHNPSPAQVAYLSETVKVHQIFHVDRVLYQNIQSDIAIIRSQALIDRLMSL